MRLKLPWLGKHRIEIIERSKFLLRVYYQPAWKFNLLYLHPRYMETPEKRRKSRNAANTQHPQRYCPPSFLVNRMSLSDDRIELGVPARLNLLVLTVLTDIWKGNGRKKKKKEKKRLIIGCVRKNYFEWMEEKIKREKSIRYVSFGIVSPVRRNVGNLSLLSFAPRFV